MTRKSEYEEKIEAIKAIKDKNILKPYMAVYIYVQEAENLYRIALEDKEKLIGAGLSEELIEDLPRRAGALREAEAQWKYIYHVHKEAGLEWKKRSSEAYQLRDYLIHSCKFAYRRRPDLLSTVARIKKKRGHADMIQDLNALAILGKENPEPLTKIGLDHTLLEKAERLSHELGSLLARYKGEDQIDHEYEKLRNKAYTLLKEAVDEIRDCGKYVFRDDIEQWKRYTSSHIRKLHRKYRKPKNKKEDDEATDLDKSSMDPQT